MRDKLWKALCAKQPVGMILPIWLLAIHAILYPIATAFWMMSKARGYQPDTDTWLIEGVRYSGEALRTMAHAQGEVYRITRTGECVTLKRLSVVNLTNQAGATGATEGVE